MTFSIIIPVYRSHTTIERCLRGVELLEHDSHEVLIVDSSPDERSAEIIRQFPRFRLLRSDRRLLMHAAKNLALREATGRFAAFLDPDCIPAPDWLSRLEETLRSGCGVVGGGIGHVPAGDLNLAAHIVKFWRWFPSERVGPVEDLPTANMVVRRYLLLAAGGFREDMIAADTELCHRLRREGWESIFDGRAVVRHIHEVTLRSLVRERFTRGQDFALMRAGLPEWTRLLSVLAVAGAPLLALRQFFWKFRAAARHGLLAGFLRTWPVVLLCDAAWMSGVALGKLRALRSGTGGR